MIDAQLIVNILFFFFLSTKLLYKGNIFIQIIEKTKNYRRKLFNV